MGGGGGSSSQTTQATQTTMQDDHSVLTEGGDYTHFGNGAQIEINDLSADVAGAAIQLAGKSAGEVAGIASDALDANSLLATRALYTNAQTANRGIDAAKEATAGAFDLASGFGKNVSNVAESGFDFASDVTKASLENSQDTTGKAFDFLTSSGKGLLGFFADQSTALQQEKIKNQEFSANLADRSFALAADKTTSSDERVFALGQKVLYAVAALVGLWLVSRLFNKKSSA